MIIFGLLILIIISSLNKVTLSTKHISRLSLLTVLFSILISYETLNISLKSGISIFNNLFHVSLLTQTFDIIILIIGFFILFLTSSYSFNFITTLKKVSDNNINIDNFIKFNEINKEVIGEYSLICLFTLFGNSLFLTSNDLISLFLGIELLSYSLYILASIFKYSYAGTKQGLTYFLLGSLASILILFGSSVIYILTGLTNLEDISILYSFGFYNYSIQFGLIFICAGLLFKVGSSPFHNWSPDVYDGVPTIVTTWISTIHKLGILLFIYQLVHYFYSPNVLNNLFNIDDFNFDFDHLFIIQDYFWIYILLIGSLLSMLIGSVSGVGQLDYINNKSRIKRILAFSGIANTGYLLLALISNSQDSLVSYMLYITQYSLSNINMFFIIVLLGYILNISHIVDKYSPIQYLNQLKGFFWVHPYLVLCFSITLFSFVGIPPLVGFFAKYLIIFGAVDNGLYILSTILIICSVISGYYYLTVLRYLFKDNLNNNPKDFDSNNFVISPSLSYIISTLSLVILLFSIYPNFILQGAHIVALFEFNI